MNKAKTLSLVFLLFACTGLAFGTSGFSSISAERGVSAEVVADDRALVNYQSSSQTVEDGGTVELVTVGNGLSRPIDVTDVSINDGSFTISDPTQPANIHSGENGTIQGTVECTPNETQTIELTVAVKGSGVTAQIFGDTESREFTLTCAPEPEATPTGTLDSAEFNGAGNFDVDATNVGETKIVYWTADGKWNKGPVTFTKQSRPEFDTTQKLQPQIKGNTGIVAVYFPQYDVTFLHPSYYDGNWGAGDGNRVHGKYHPDNGPR